MNSQVNSQVKSRASLKAKSKMAVLRNSIASMAIGLAIGLLSPLLGSATLLSSANAAENPSSAQTHQAQSHTVIMKSISFDPKVMQIKAGESVVWTNKSYTEHTATGEAGTFDTGKVAPSQSSNPVVFQKPGTYSYHCSVHGRTMSGTITVTGG